MKTKEVVWAPALLGLGAALGVFWAKRAWMSAPMDTRSFRDLLRSRHRDSFSSPVIRRSPSDIDVAVAP